MSEKKTRKLSKYICAHLFGRFYILRRFIGKFKVSSCLFLYLNFPRLKVDSALIQAFSMSDFCILAKKLFLGIAKVEKLGTWWEKFYFRTTFSKDVFRSSSLKILG